jgi:hypothetical protein
VWLDPRKIHTSRPQCGDLILGVAFELVVSKRFEEAYSAAGLTGILSFGLIGSGQGHYYAARPKITFTVLDEEASGVIWEQEPTCHKCRLGAISQMTRVIIDESTWDGSDIFMGTGLYGVKLVTDRAVAAIQEAKLSNFVFVPAEEYSFSAAKVQ